MLLRTDFLLPACTYALIAYRSYARARTRKMREESGKNDL